MLQKCAKKYLEQKQGYSQSLAFVRNLIELQFVGILQRNHKQCDGDLRAVVQNVIEYGQKLAVRLATKVHD